MDAVAVTSSSRSDVPSVGHQHSFVSQKKWETTTRNGRFLGLWCVALSSLFSSTESFHFRFVPERRRVNHIARNYRALDEIPPAVSGPTPVTTSNAPEDVLLDSSVPHLVTSSSPTSPKTWRKKVHRTSATRARKEAETDTVSNVHELRRKVLDEKCPFREIDIRLDVQDVSSTELLSHDVVQVLVQRFHDKSTPKNRQDQHYVALSIEGGGMRGAVSAGMAAAIACLGLTDSFDAIYGSSAGSVIGAYMVSRQMCMDVYVDVLTAAKKRFVCTRRMFGALAVTGMDWFLPSGFPKFATNANPGMNISFVLDGVMDHDHGIRPLDLARFLENDRKQPLRIASSYVKNGQLGTKSFGTDDFATARRADGTRTGVYPCLEASMTVPGATGPPVPIHHNNETLPYFDAFCFEPLPYRSAVADGATHVLCLCSRPEGFQPKSKPGVYELGVAPLYFYSHGEPQVAQFFERGGQQYIYAEDLLTMEEGKRAGVNGRGPILVPPPRVLYGVDDCIQDTKEASRRENWNKAHLLPLKVPIGTPELPTLQQDRDAVLQAVRGGFASAFDLLAPAIGLDVKIRGKEVACMVFPDECLYDDTILEKQLRVYGDAIGEVSTEPEQRRLLHDLLGPFRILRLRRRRNSAGRLNSFATSRKVNHFGNSKGIHRIGQRHKYSVAKAAASDHSDPLTLLDILPGFQSGRMAHLAAALRLREKGGSGI